MFRVEIPIRMHTSDTARLEELNLAVDPDDAIIRMLTCYRIDCIHEDTDGENFAGTCIYSGGQVFSSPLSVQEVDQLIHEALKGL